MNEIPSPVFRGQPLEPVFPDGQTVKMIGLGGVGNIVARYGSVFLAALAEALGRHARIVLVDGDVFEPTNTTRMLFTRMGNKAAVVRQELLAHLADSQLSFDAIEEYVTKDNVERLVRNGDIVILTVDNHATRRLVSEFCAGEGGWCGLDEICLISGGNDGIGPDTTGRVRRGTYGNCQVYLRRGGNDLSPSLTHHHEEIRNPGDKRPDEQDCVEALESSQQNLCANLTAAACILNTLWLYLCGGAALHYGEIVFDIAEGLMRPVPRPGPGDR